MLKLVAHADHAHYISFLHRDIPIHYGKIYRLILETVEEENKSADTLKLNKIEVINRIINENVFFIFKKRVS